MFNIAKLVGETIEERYEVTERLHMGGMGVVYLATDTRLDRKVVVKIPHAKLLAERGFSERFDREIRSLMKLEHPHIVTVYDAGTMDIYPFAVFQYLAGGSLLKRIQTKGRLSPDEVGEWLPPIAGALDFMHSRQLLHRDVKPSNLLFDDSGNLIVADFGVVKSTDRTQEDLELTMRGEVPGSPEYMAPESITASDLTGAYDQYALGVSVYLSLAGKFPYTFKNPLEALVRKKEPTPLLEVAPSLPPAVANAVMKTMAADPSGRFANCAEFAEAVRAGATEAPAPAKAAKPVVPVIDAGDIPIDPPTRPRGSAPDGSERKTIGVGTPIEAIRAQFGDEPAGPPNVPAESQTRILQKPRGTGTNKLLATVVGLMCVVLVFVVYVKFFGSGGNKKTTAGGGDVRAPKITIAKPVGDFVTRAKVVRVEGQVDDDSAQVTIEGRAVTVGADGWFFYDMDLPREGEFILDIRAQNRAGRLGEAAIKVTRDTKPPILRVKKPASKPRVRAESYTVTGTVDAGTDTVVVNGHPADIDGESFRAVVPLSEEGEIKFEVVARDKAGNETLDTFVVTRDATAPRVELVFPPSGGQAFRTSEGVIEVRGSVDDGEATLTVGGAACVLNPDGTFRAVVELKEAGEQAIEIVVTDAVGNSARAEARVYQDTPLVIYEPRDGKTTNQAEIRVRGRVYGSGTKVTINGTPVETDGAGGFQSQMPLAIDGAHSIKVDAEEKDGKVTTSTMRLARDTVQPMLTVVDPEAALTTSAGSVYAVKGVVSDSSGVDVFVNGRRARITGNPAESATWEANIAFPVGTPELVVVAVDAGGNRSAVVTRELRMGTPEFAGLEFVGKSKSGLFRYALIRDKSVSLVLIPETSFVRGAAQSDKDAKANERPARRLRVGPFLIAESPITWQQYLFFCDQAKREKPPTDGPPTHPAVRLSWEDARAYCEWAGVRLPTEAEWELAARAGKTTRYPWGDDWMDKKANVELRAGGTTPVGSYKWVNDLGLSEVVGNVWEWCADFYAPGAYQDETQVNPSGPAAGSTRVLRGGSWRDSRQDARVSARNSEKPGERADDIGFRIARGPDNSTPEKKPK